MKKTIHYLTGLFCLGIMITGCQQHAHESLTRKHYRDGQYLDYAEKPKADKNKTAVDAEVADAEVKSLEKTNSIEVIHEENSVSNAELQKMDTLIAANSYHIPYASTVAENEGDESFVTEKKFRHYLPVVVRTVHFPQKFEKYSGGDQAPQSTDDTRSIIWTIVLIILILWAIAYFTGGWGLGGLIHLLLVIALILFILWLLRII